MSFMMRRGIVSSGVGGSTFDVNSLSLNGTTQHGKITNSLTDADAISIAFWMNADVPNAGDGSTHYIVMNRGARYSIYLDTSGLLRFDNFFAGSTFTYDFQESGQWVHICCTVDASHNGVLYVDGTQEGSGVVDRSAKGVGDASTYIGCRETLDDRFSGSLAILRIANSVYTQADVTEMYNEGVALCYAAESASLTSKTVIAPRLANWDTNAGDELVDQTGNGVTTDLVGSPTYTDSGLTVFCS